MTMEDYTPTQRSVLILLMDGHPHRKEELKRVAGDDAMQDNTLAVHVSNMRKKLRVSGQDISVETASQGYCNYRLIRLTSSHARNSSM